MAETAAAVAEAPVTTTTEIPADGAPPKATEAVKAAEETVAKSDTTPAKGTEPPASGPPEKYALTVADPELVSAEVLAAFEVEAKADGLTQAQAQARLDRQIESVYAQAETFRTRVAADPVYGGEKLVETQQMAESVLTRFAPQGDPLGDEFRTIMRSSNYGNALPVVAFLAKIGKAMAEDTAVGGGTHVPKEAPMRAADRAYINTTSAHLKDQR